MSGHSKWAQIKRQKGAADIKKGQVFTKLANAIIIAIRQGGGITDPEANFRLRLAMEKARSANMPKENIQRAIERARGALSGGLEEVVYEGYGPGGMAIIVEAATDSRQRTLAEVRNVFEKSGGTLGGKGTVAYLFESTGMIIVPKNGREDEEIMLFAADLGASDVEEAGGVIEVYTKPEELNSVKEKLQSEGLKVESFELTQKPKTTVPISDPETAQRVLAFVEKLESLDDVQRVFANFDIPDELLV